MNGSPTRNVPFCTSTVVRDEEDHLQQRVDASALFGRDLARNRVAAVLLDHHLAFCELLLDAVGLRVGFVDLVDRYHHRNTRRLGVVDGLDGLRLDAVVGGNHQDHDIRDPGAAGAHHGERLVARCVEEGDVPVTNFDLVGANVLGDATRLPSDDVGGPDRVQ